MAKTDQQREILPLGTLVESSYGLATIRHDNTDQNFLTRPDLKNT